MHVRPLLLALCLAAPVAAQFDHDLEKRSAGRLGGALDLEVVGAAPSSILLLVPSTSGGPTPLSLLDPGDLRVLAVGTDLLWALTPLVTDPAGGATYSLPLVNNPSLQGYELHWQTVQLALGATFFGELGNDVVTQLGLPDTGAIAPQSLTSPRAFAALAADADNNASAADVLVSGGGSGSLTGATGLATTERWDYRRMRVVPGPTMGTARALHLTVELADGRTLVIGGADGAGAVLSSCEIYDPVANTFTPTGSMSTPRILHAACRLADGRVMVAGGTSTLTDVVTALTGTLNSVEIWSPLTGTWTGTSNLAARRLAPALTLLPSGQVMASGGIEVTVFIIPLSAVSTTNVQRWNPVNGSWTSGPNMPQGRAGHHYNQVRLADGRILMTGGVNVQSLATAQTATPIAGADLYNPTSNTWSTATMPNARALHTATLLADGRVVVCGGSQGTLTAPTSIANVDVFSPTNNTWTPAPALSGPRAGHLARLLPDGLLVLFGGQGAAASLTSIETLRF